MKTIFKFLSVVVFSMLAVSSCNYLDVLPVDELNKDEDAFKDADAIQNYLFSCYSFLPDIRREYVASTLMTGGEVISSNGTTSDYIVTGQYSATNTVYADWNNYFKGIVQCYLLLRNIDRAPDLREEIKREYMAEATFLIGYFHALIYRLYGPVIIYDEEYMNQDLGVNIPSSEFHERTNLDGSLDYIIGKIDEALKIGLHDGQFTDQYYGRVNRQTALAVKAILLSQAASPLYNGAHDPENPAADDLRDFYREFNNNAGEPLMNLTYDKSKWDKAVAALKEAINAAEAGGRVLYEDVSYAEKYPTDPAQRNLRFMIMDWNNTQEIIWDDARVETGEAFQRLLVPWVSFGQGRGCVGPTLQYLYGFYTDKGVFIEDDPDFRYKVDEQDKSAPKAGDKLLYGEQEDESNGSGVTALFNMHREPRFYAWVGYHNGFYEIVPSKEEIVDNNVYREEWGKDRRVRLQLRANDHYGKNKEQNPTYYSPTGYLVKKWCMPYFPRDNKYLDDYKFSNIRLADIYLLYAEALIEQGTDLQTAKVYIDKVRRRAGLKGVDESWAAVGKEVDRKLLRKIVRQEIMSEFFIENHTFYDVRRWLVAKPVYASKPLGLNVDGATDEEFYKVVEVNRQMSFTNRNYLMPLPQKDINISRNLKQNPGW